jgi:uncharacterized protein
LDAVLMLHLPDSAKQAHQVKLVTLGERLPVFLSDPCHLTISYHVDANDGYYLIHMNVSGNLNITCQRCMEQFISYYNNDTTIAVCRTDERAEQLLEQYECIVASNWQIDLEELVIDELHLYAPPFHPEINDCDSEINEILTVKNETY